MSTDPAISIQGLTHRYGDHVALDAISFGVACGEIFGLLGPNGGGKTTLFRILSTILPLQQGIATLLGLDVARRQDDVRRRIGVTFQSPSLDIKLSVRENLSHQAYLYGLSGRLQRQRVDSLLEQLGLASRASDRVESLSGGLKRRVEIAKGLLHQPQLLLLDEPSTGLDPGARHDLWRYLRQLRQQSGVTVLVTTHLMEEADHCDRLGILDRGRLVAIGTPDELRASIGGDCVTIEPKPGTDLAQLIESQFSVTSTRVGESLRIERERGHEFVREVVEAFPDDVLSISFGKPTLEDVFIQRTGHRFWEEEPE